MTVTEWRGDMPRTELAELLGVSLSTLKRWENGTSRVPHLLTIVMRSHKPGELKEYRP